MKTAQVVKALTDGATLCAEHSRDGMVYWLEPRRTIIRRDIAESVIRLPGMIPGKDGLFDGVNQTWKLERARH